MPASEVLEPDLASAAIQRHRAIERQVRRRHFDFLHLIQIGEGVGRLPLERGLLLRIAFLSDPLLQGFDACRHRRDAVQEGVLLHDVGQHPPPRVVMADHLHVGGKHLVAERMIVVIVGVDHISHRPGGHGLQIGDQSPRRGRCDLRVDHDRLIVGHDDRRIGADIHRARRRGVVDPVGDCLEPVRTADNRSARLRPAVEHNPQSKEGDEQDGDTQAHGKAFQDPSGSPARPSSADSVIGARTADRGYCGRWKRPM